MCNTRNPRWPEEIYIFRDNGGQLQRVLEIFEYFNGQRWCRYSHLAPEKPLAAGLDPLQRDAVNWRHRLNIAPITAEGVVSLFLENYLPAEFRRLVCVPTGGVK